MKFRITKENIEGYNTELKIRRMNYDQVVVNYQNNSGIKTFKMNEGELVSEGEVVDLVKSFKTFKDFTKSTSKRGIWDKEILIYLNESYPIKIEASGRNFREDSYKFNYFFIDI